MPIIQSPILQDIVYMTNKYLGRVDPLQLLRSMNMNGKKIKCKDKYLVFEKDLKLNLNTPTAWMSKHTRKQYTIGALWVLLAFLSKDSRSTAEYISSATEYEVETVNVADRDQIFNYFSGKIAESDCINSELKLQLASKKTNNQNNPSQQPRKIEELSEELQLAEYLLRVQRPLMSRTRRLRCPTKSFQHLLKVIQQPQSVKSTTKTRLQHIYSKKHSPIIIVPEACVNGNISLSNVESFLVHGRYVEPEPMKEATVRKIDLEYQLRDKKILFEVTNNPSLLSEQEWKNVVGVFISGMKNQFSLWSVRDPGEIFKKAKGFLMRYRTQTDNQTTQLNISILNLERHARYGDANVQEYVWELIESVLFEKY